MCKRESAIGVVAMMAVVAFMGSASAQEPQEREQPPRAERQMEPATGMFRAERLVGVTVTDPRNEQIAHIQDLAVSPRTGEIQYVVLGYGGLLGIGEKYVAVPWDRIDIQSQERTVSINITKAQLESAETFDWYAAWPAEVSWPFGVATETRETTQTRQTRPTDERERSGEKASAERTERQAVLEGTELLGMAVMDRQDNRLGMIEDLAVKSNGQISYVILAHGGFAGIGDKYVAIPWDRFQWRAGRTAKNPDITGAQLAAAETFDYPRGPWTQTVSFAAASRADRPDDGTRQAERTKTERAKTEREEPERTDARRGQTEQSPPAVLKSADIVGISVENHQGEELATVEEVALHPETGKISYVVLAAGGVAGIGETLVAVPWDRVDLNGNKGQEMVLTLNVSRSQFEKARKFESARNWPATVTWPFGAAGQQ